MRISDWSSDVCSSDLVSRKAIAKLTVIESQAGLSATSNTAILDGEAPDKKNGSDLRPLSEQTHAITSEAMAAAFRNPNALGKLEAVISSLDRSEEHTSELQPLMRISYAVFCLKKQKQTKFTI